MLMSDLKQKKNQKYDRQQLFDMLADVARLLMVSHKGFVSAPEKSVVHLSTGTFISYVTEHTTPH